MPLFSEPREQGHREWSMFNVVRHDPVGGVRVPTPPTNTHPPLPHRPSHSPPPPPYHSNLRPLGSIGGEMVIAVFCKTLE